MIITTLNALAAQSRTSADPTASRAYDCLLAALAVHSERDNPARDIAEYFRLWLWDLEVWAQQLRSEAAGAAAATRHPMEFVEALGLGRYTTII